jgi:hypothetical protein
MNKTTITIERRRLLAKALAAIARNLLICIDAGVVLVIASLLSRIVVLGTLSTFAVLSIRALAVL